MAELQMLLEEIPGPPGSSTVTRIWNGWPITARTTTSRCDASADAGVLGLLAAERRVGTGPGAPGGVGHPGAEAATGTQCS